MVAYRDGFDTAGNPVGWTVVPASTPDALKMVTFMAQEAYSIAVVCAVDANTVLTWESLRTVSEDLTDTVTEPVIDTPCSSAPPARNLVTGKLIQAGFAHLDDADAQTASANQDITLSVPNGTFDLVATTDLADASMNKTLIRRGIAITGNQSLGDIDASTGLAQSPVAISLDNPPSADPKKSTEVVEATVDVRTKNNAGPAPVSHASYDLDKKAIKIYALSTAMLMPGDTQTATFTGTDHPKDTTITTTRSITRPFESADDVATGKEGFALPPKIAIPDWRTDAVGRLNVALPTLPTLDSLTIETSGVAMTGGKTAKYEIDISSGYFDATTLARPVFDTNIPGFKLDWTINFKQHYSRQITSEHDVFDEGVFIDHEESQFLEDVPAAP
jgi:hypothetical protein